MIQLDVCVLCMCVYSHVWSALYMVCIFYYVFVCILSVCCVCVVCVCAVCMLCVCCVCVYVMCVLCVCMLYVCCVCVVLCAVLCVCCVCMCVQVTSIIKSFRYIYSCHYCVYKTLEFNKQDFSLYYILSVNITFT